MSLGTARNRFNVNAAGAVVGFTIVLTASFVGVMSFVSGHADGVGGRLPFYVLAAAAVFVISLWYLDDTAHEGLTVLLAVSGVTAISFVLITLAVEGVVFSVSEPGLVLTSHLLVYFLAASLICTGLGIWGLHHWREFTDETPLDRRRL